MSSSSYSHSRIEAWSAPFLDGIQRYEVDGVLRFHTPGHKRGLGLHPGVQGVLGEAARFDVSDVLASPEYGDSWSDALRAAEDLAARAFGARATRFSVNGTTGALHAMLLALRMAGFRRVVMPRSSHLSILGGLIVADLEPVYVDESVLKEWGIPLPPGAEDFVARARAAGVDRPACLVTYPTYYGVGASLAPLASAVHAEGGVLLVDEAHGAHFRFHPRLPRSALEQGADLVAQSTHKVLGALTQASMLHSGSEAIPVELIDRALFWLQSTSPSSLLLASLDAARAQMEAEGLRLWEQALERVEALGRRLAREGGIRLLDAEAVGEGYVQDPTRVVVRTADAGWHGVAAARRLRERGIQVEMADPWNLVAIVTWADAPGHLDRLAEALIELRREAPPAGGVALAPDVLPPFPRATPRMSPRAAMLARSRRIPLREAVGAVSADVVCPYPPGIPVLCPGEEIDAAVVEYLEAIHSFAFEVRGTVDPRLNFIHIVSEGT